MDEKDRASEARALLGESYPAVLEHLRELIAKGVSAPDQLDDFVSTVVAFLAEEERSRRRALQAQGIAEGESKRRSVWQ